MASEQDAKRQKTGAEKEVVIKFRNYTPKDKTLAHEITPAPAPVDTSANMDLVQESVNKLRAMSGVKPVKPKISGFVQDAGQELVGAVDTEPAAEEVPIAELAPKKANWDLKRDVSKKMAKLEKRTEKALYDMLRQKLDEDAQA